MVGGCLAFKFDLNLPRIGRSFGSSLAFLGAILAPSPDLPCDQFLCYTVYCANITVQHISCTHLHFISSTDAAIASPLFCKASSRLRLIKRTAVAELAMCGRTWLFTPCRGY